MLPKRLTNFALLIDNAIQKGMLLFIAVFLALIISNSGQHELYEQFFQSEISIVTAKHSFGLSIREWINDLLMAIFFFGIGMEIKRELTSGHLSKNDQRLLPLISAIGGVVCPVIFFLFFNADHPENIRGWAIPAATDIAFALGVLSLCGKGLPISLRIFLTALAIIDDLIAILIIALFYTETLYLNYLWYVAFCIMLLGTLLYHKVASGLAYILIGSFMWAFVLASGVHATIAGVILGLLIPMHSKDGRKPIEEIEKNLNPLISYVIVPLFAFANGGVNLNSFTFDTLYTPVVIGICSGLFLGKQIGIFGSVWLLVKSRIATLPENTTFGQFYVISIICGIGFTMSLFIGLLAFSGMEQYTALIKIGVLSGSLLSFIFGSLLLRIIRIRARSC